MIIYHSGIEPGAVRFREGIVTIILDPEVDMPIQIVMSHAAAIALQRQLVANIPPQEEKS